MTAYSRENAVIAAIGLAACLATCCLATCCLAGCAGPNARMGLANLDHNQVAASFEATAAVAKVDRIDRIDEITAALAALTLSLGGGDSTTNDSSTQTGGIRIGGDVSTIALIALGAFGIFVPSGGLFYQLFLRPRRQIKEQRDRAASPGWPVSLEVLSTTPPKSTFGPKATAGNN